MPLALLLRCKGMEERLYEKRKNDISILLVAYYLFESDFKVLGMFFREEGSQ